MSKSRGNVVNPDEIIESYGADSLRLFYMFLGPLEKAKPWSSSGVQGSHRFVRRIWNLLINEEGELYNTIDDSKPDETLTRLLNQTIRKVTEDLDALRFNTAISQLMIFVNALKELTSLPKTVVETLVLLLSPLTPHICEELWEKMGYSSSLAYEIWPSYSEELAKGELITIAVQINGKKRAEIEVAPDIDEKAALDLAKAENNISRYINGKEIKKIILVKNRLLSIVI